MPPKGSNPFPGVHLDKRYNKWRAVLRLGSEVRHVGVFSSAQEAREAIEARRAALPPEESSAAAIRASHPSGLHGVIWRYGKWHVAGVGYFSTLEEAVAACHARPRKRAIKGTARRALEQEGAPALSGWRAKLNKYTVWARDMRKGVQAAKATAWAGLEGPARRAEMAAELKRLWREHKEKVGGVAEEATVGDEAGGGGVGEAAGHSANPTPLLRYHACQRARRTEILAREDVLGLEKEHRGGVVAKELGRLCKEVKAQTLI